ncbi:DNA polymerase domain-containing protein [Egicoccus halophilus]|uniref:ATP-dependent DNA ligase n=1 Tax=Egicoccus halophilus TaxID=1670830 RepID=A0A8J3EXC3_9ACTN|nr:DNA ligase polymerase domain-containing protein [Egicoccus halophilus]GGI05472.1 ATP-dependent DNA ligase [Egicoccus halophilus]
MATGAAQRQTVEVPGTAADGTSVVRRLSVSNLGKVYWPQRGTTKAAFLNYLVAIAPAMLPHLAHRPVTFKRYPDGVEGQSFFEKRCPPHKPDWLATTTLPKRGTGRWGRPIPPEERRRPRPGEREELVEHCDLADTAALVWAGNLGALELHVPMGRAPDPSTPRAVVFDLDPGAPADVITCAQVALRLREVFDRLSLTAVPKTSGGKGLQLYVPLNVEGVTYDDTSGFSQQIAQLLERVHPELVVSRQTKTERVGRVLIDWYQNTLTKTTVCVYSPRARERPTVSTPVTWDEVSDAADDGDPEALRFELDDVIARVEAQGDLFAPVARLQQELPTLA